MKVKVLMPWRNPETGSYMQAGTVTTVKSLNSTQGVHRRYVRIVSDEPKKKKKEPSPVLESTVEKETTKRKRAAAKKKASK